MVRNAHYIVYADGEDDSLLQDVREMSPREVLCLGLLLVAVAGEYSDGGFMPSSSFRTEDQLAEPSARVEKSREDREQNDRTQRFGISTYGTTGAQGGYGGTSPGLYGPVKIDLGGVLIGSILGFGAVLILPKIMHVLSYGYGGGYGRSVDTDSSALPDMLTRLDETLARYNIDSGACTQRLACSYVQLANENMQAGNATEFDALLANLSSNSLVRRMLDGTAVFEAVTAGRSRGDCQHLYPKCKLDKKTVVKVLTQLVPS